jgi:uncharacterized membrane protein YphA (DoxX/SURF4 family)
MEQISRGPAHQAYLLLRIAFIAIPLIAGLDKFFDCLVDWDQFIGPWLGGYGFPLMMIAGVVEVIAGLGVIFKPRIFAPIIGLWLIFIVLNLVALGDFYDIALRDLGLCLSAFALGRLAKVYN